VDVDRAAVRGLDVHKKTAMAALRTPGPGARRQQVMEYSTYTEGLVALLDWLVAEGITQMVMSEAGWGHALASHGDLRASVGARRAARTAGYRPARAPMARDATNAPAMLAGGTTMDHDRLPA